MEKIPDPVLANDPAPAPDAQPGQPEGEENTLIPEALFDETPVNVIEPDPVITEDTKSANAKYGSKKEEREATRAQRRKLIEEARKEKAAQEEADAKEEQRSWLERLAFPYLGAYDD